MKDLLRCQSRQGEQGQVLPLLALGMVVLTLFLGLAVDMGFAYVTKANLSKATDAAALAGMRNLNQGQAAAAAIAQSAFAANYPAGGLNVSVPVPTVTFTTNAQGLTQINVTASTTINTFFARVLPSFSTVSVGNTAQSTRANVGMTLVLDRSGSMLNNDGSVALPIAVNTFLTYFSDSLDQVALTSFASNATLNVAIEHNFTSAINNTVSGWTGGTPPNGFGGATFALGGLQLAQTQENSVATPNVLKVVVFFTDGIANTIQDNLNCPGYPLVNYGGEAPSESPGNLIWFMDPATGSVLPVGSNYHITSGGVPLTSVCNATGFRSQQYGTTESFTNVNITSEAEYRVLQLANTIRTATTPPTVIYTVGLGNATNTAFLQQLANDSHSAFYNSSQPAGIAVMASDCPGPNCVAELQQAFQTVATDILLRLTQ